VGLGAALELVGHGAETGRGSEMAKCCQIAVSLKSTLTLRNVPDDLGACLKARAKRHRRSLHNETISALELADAGATSASDGAAFTVKPEPVEPAAAVSEEALAKIRATLARFPGSAKAAQQPRDPEGVREELELFTRLRSQFKGSPLTSEEIITAIERESHPPELDRFGFRINPES
jgi:plasmid stability protein